MAAGAGPGRAGHQAPPVVPAGGSRRTSRELPRPTVSANLGLRLIQLHLVVIYGMAGLSKLQGPSWWTGLAIWKTMTTGEFVAIDFTALAAWPVLINLLTHRQPGTRALYPVLVWVRIVRPLRLGRGGGASRRDRGHEPWSLRICPGDDRGQPGVCLGLVAARARDRAGNSRRLRVLYDGACPRCRASMALITAADPDRVVEPVDLTAVAVASIHPSLTHEACMRSMHVVSRTGKVTRRVRRRAVGGGLAAAVLAAGVGQLPAGGRMGRTGCVQ